MKGEMKVEQRRLITTLISVDKEYRKVIDIIKTKVLHIYQCKPMIKYLVENSCGKPLVGCEIGVLNGHNAYSILFHLAIKCLYLVDPYIQYGIFPNPKKNSNNAHRLLKQFKTDSYHFICKKSEDAIDDVPNNLDFVYIDGDHSYEFIKKDIDLYYPKMKKGGVFGGHNFEVQFSDVSRAVLEFIDKTGLELYGDKTDWWTVVK